MNVVVLGMHRSGTSLACGLLHRAGVYFGESPDLIRPNEENPKGFWERTDVRALNDSLLHALNSDWSEIAFLDQHELPEEELSRFHESAASILTEMKDCAPGGVIGLKEPRLCVLMNFWLPLLAEQTFFILVHRDPEEIAISLESRNGIPFTVSNYLTEQYLGRVLMHVNTDLPSTSMKHIYLRDARTLRPDR